MNLHQLNPQVSVVLSEKIEHFVQRILMFSREKLQAIYLYGDVTRADFNLEHSPVQAMLVFQEVSTDLLEILAPAAMQAHQDFKLELKILSREDLHTSADVFPMEFCEAKEKRFLLYGTHLFQNMSISLEDLRRSCELELKRELFQLRNYFVLHLKRPKDLLQRVLDSLPVLLGHLDRALFLKSGKFCSSNAEIIEKSSDIFRIDRKLLLRLQQLKEGTTTLKDPVELLHLYNKYLYAIAKMARLIDKYEVYR